MITTQLTKLIAEENHLLTDGVQFVHSVILREGESADKWHEITEYEFKCIQAKMTPREFILKLFAKGITKAQLETLINSSDQVWAELNYATVINRANPLLDQLCGQFGLTPADVDEIFGI